MEKLEITFDQWRKHVTEDDVRQLFCTTSLKDNEFDIALCDVILKNYSVATMGRNRLFKGVKPSKLKSRIGVVKRSIVYQDRTVNPQRYAQIVERVGNAPHVSERKVKKKPDLARQIAALPKSELRDGLTALEKARVQFNAALATARQRGTKIGLRAEDGKAEMSWLNPPRSVANA